MKYNLSIFVFIAALGLFAAVPAYAETSIAVVDVKRLMSESKAAQDLQMQLKTQRDEFLEEISRQEEQLRAEEQILAEQRDELTQEEFTKKRQEFEKKFLEARGRAQSRKDTLDEALGKATGRLKNEIYKAVEAIASARNFDVVLSRQSVVLSDKSFDITEEAMKKLNATISSLPLDQE